jgi:ribosome-interacting GTPase 1
VRKEKGVKKPDHIRTLEKEMRGLQMKLAEEKNQKTVKRKLAQRRPHLTLQEYELMSSLEHDDLFDLLDAAGYLDMDGLL